MKIVCFGDSLTTCGGVCGRYSDLLADRFPDFEVINAGVGGEAFPDALARIDDVVALRPDIVLIEYGANDWWRGERPPEAWGTDLEKCIRRFEAAGAKCIVLGCFGQYHDHSSGEWREKEYGADERSREYREIERAVAERHGCPYLVNIQSEIIDDRTCWHDRNHPNEHGNRKVADQIAPLLEQLTGVKALPKRTRVMKTLQDFWEEAVELAPGQLAAACQNERLTYRQADERCARMAFGLYKATGKASPRVAVCLPNCLEYFIVYWALVKMGGVIVPVNPWLKADSLSTIMDNVRPDAIILQGSGDAELVASLEGHMDIPAFSLDECAEFRRFSELEADDGEIPPVKANPEDAAIIMHTSGTTSAPKGAVMRHSDLIFNVMTTINAQDFVPTDIHILVNPMFHCTALYSSLPAAAYQKTPVIITAETQPDKLLEIIQSERITTFLTVPSILQRVTAFPQVNDYDTSSLRVIGYAGSFMPVKTVRQLQALFPNVQLHNFFGLTETISATHVLGGDASLDRPDSIGKPLPFVYARITAEDGRECEADEVGELLFARENVITGYWGKPGKLEESIVEFDGREWFRTGDLASRDSEGYYFIKGRKKDMIIVGGENVFAAEVEAALMLCESVKEAAVIGIPATGVRESLGEMIKAFIVPESGVKLTEAEIRKHCRKTLPSYKIPHIIVFMDKLPRNPSGKIVKAELPR